MSSRLSEACTHAHWRPQTHTERERAATAHTGTLGEKMVSVYSVELPALAILVAAILVVGVSGEQSKGVFRAQVTHPLNCLSRKNADTRFMSRLVLYVRAL